MSIVFYILKVILTYNLFVVEEETLLTGQDIFPSLDISNREMICLLLDTRTACKRTLLTKTKWEKSIDVLKIVYIGFYVKYNAEE